jgi:hypothetical protein
LGEGVAVRDNHLVRGRAVPVGEDRGPEPELQEHPLRLVDAVEPFDVAGLYTFNHPFNLIIVQLPGLLCKKPAAHFSARRNPGIIVGKANGHVQDDEWPREALIG